MDFSSRYQKLNDAQRQAVDHIDGPVMVIAGPGTGKTELLSMRAANILKKTDVLPGNILCLTFTESGAHAMRERLSQIIGADAYKIAIHTFHSFGSEVINQHGEFFYHGAHFRPADELSSHELISRIFDELDYDNPLAVKMNGDYPYLNDTLTTISELKKSGLTSDELLRVLDANDEVIDTTEPLLRQAFGTRISKSTAAELQKITPTIRESGGDTELATIAPLSRILADSLQVALDEAEGSTKPLTAWKNTWMKKNEAGELVLKSRERSKKLRAVSYVYFQYLTRMQEAELYDFDDMILRVVHAMEVFPELRFNLQEKYQYIMVDEFQDTNMAQMRILFDLTSNEINEGRPNIMVVGDDDQAIYSFQGADVGNIHNFRDTFSTAELIVLTENYRSAPVVLSAARSVITQGSDRLENRIAELNKTLEPHRPEAGSSVSVAELPTINDERHWLVNSIKQSIDAGQDPSAIAVLARRHHEIMALLPYFAEAGIRVNYERRDNVLDLEVIRIIEHISEILIALFESRLDDADSRLPELLTHPAFGFSPTDIWRLSITAKANRQSWMEVMAVTPVFVPLHTWLLVQAQSIRHVPLEHMCDHIIGHKQTTEPIDSVFVSPLYEYFFSKERLESAPDDYLTFLEALRCIRQKMREYQPDQIPTLQTFIEFIRLNRDLGSTITSVRPSADKIDRAVNLMTAHKSKGLEFDTVYITGAIDSAWGERVRTRSRLIGYPENLPLSPSGDTFDERLRLFFVAMTRAKKQLFISYSTLDSSDKNTMSASFLAGHNWQTQKPNLHSTLTEITHAAELAWYQPLIRPIQSSMKELLQPQLESYKLSATHLNSFLDITRGGPQTFLLNNLLRFPQAISPSAGYGVAIHSTLQRAHAHLAATGKSRPLEDILHDFEEALEAQRLSAADFQSLLQKGTATLSRFLSEKYGDFKPSQKVELNFANQGVVIGSARLTGSLDLVDFDDTTISITDYKTGKPSRSWAGKTDYEKIKLHKYKQQLMFYELLVRHSRSYSQYTIEKGSIQFVEATPDGAIVRLDAIFTEEELERFSRLIQKVYHCITTLELPGIEAFDPSYKGMLAFEAWLLDEEA